MHYIISAPSSLTSPSFPFLFYPLQTRKPNHCGRITISSFQNPHISIRRPPNAVPSPPLLPKMESNPLPFIQKTLTAAIFFATFAFLPAFFVPMPATAAPAVASVRRANEKAQERKAAVATDHEYSEYTRRLLSAVAVLLQKIDNVKSGRGEMAQVKESLREVVLTREQLQNEILDALNGDLDKTQTEKEELENRAKKVLQSFGAAELQVYGLGSSDEQSEKLKEKAGKLQKKMDAAEREYNEVCEKVENIEDAMLRKETMAYSVGIRELWFIQKECEALVAAFELRRKEMNSESVAESSSTQLSRYDIQKDLEATQKEYWEQLILPSAVDMEDFAPSLDPTTKYFVSNIMQQFKESREMQSNLEARIRQKLRRYGDEKRIIVNTPGDEVVKGFPEIELKWTFGEKEVVVPKADRLHLYHGWKKWREEAKADLKRELLENVESGRQYVAQRQELILLDRDRVVARTWYNDERNRWEMDPMAVPYAVSKKLVKNVRIRHDRGAMYLALKGEDNDYYVDSRDFDLLFEDSGGFDGLYLKMLASGIPTAVHWMWIPFSEMDIRQQFLLIARLSYQSIVGFWKFKYISNMRQWCYANIKNTIGDIMVMIGFPILEFVIPRRIRIMLGMTWPEEGNEAVDFNWYLKWQFQAEMSFRARHRDGALWFLLFFARSFILLFVGFNVLCFMKRKIPRFLGYGPYRRDPNYRKLKRMKSYLKFRRGKLLQMRKESFDPIRTAFDRMKRVKNPPIKLKDFSCLDSMREEINEIVAFLQNPTAFQEMGARPPRGVLIVGERGTGKTSLALAIAAEAKVPVVEVKARELEGGLWAGQSASNVRELFQTARDLAPVILFIEDFDLFAGIRGKFIHTREHDHEAFINQLLVELDGFENQDGVVLIATTRNLKRIDPALRRPGRMDRVLRLQQLTETEREKILCMAAEETMDSELVGFVDWKKVAEKMALLRPMELKLVPLALEGTAFRSKLLDIDELISYCGWLASLSDIVPERLRKSKLGKGISEWLVNHLGLSLTREDIESVVDLMEPYGQISNGIDLLSPPLDWTTETKFPHAVWAAGRGLITLLLPNFDEVDYIWLEQGSWQGIGFTKMSKARNEGSMHGNVETRSYLEKKLVLCFGSHIAAQMLLPFGEENFLSEADLSSAQEIATRMVIQYGWGPDDSPTIYYCSNSHTALSMGNYHEYEMAARVEKMYNLAYDKAKEMLQKNRRVLEIIVEQLIEFESLSGKDLLNILEENGGVREREPFFLSNQHRNELVAYCGNTIGPAILGATS